MRERARSNHMTHGTIACGIRHQARQFARRVENIAIQRMEFGERDAERRARQTFAQRDELRAGGNNHERPRQWIAFAPRANLLDDGLSFARARRRGKQIQ